MTPSVRADVAAAVVALGALAALYFGLARLEGRPFSLTDTPQDRYGLLTEAWISGQLHLKLPADPALLALPDPYDPALNRPFRTPRGTQDASLYDGRLYYYFGPAPVLTLFAPVRLLTGRYLREDAAVPLFALALVAFAWAAVRRVVRHCGWPWDGQRSVAVVAVLGLTPLLAFASRTPETYETAIVAGACFAAAGVFCVTGVLCGRASLWTLSAAGLSFGLAFASRPTHATDVVLLAVASLGVVRGGATGRASARSRAQQLAALWAPWLVVAGLVLLHNVARFGRVGEFGVTYVLSSWPHGPATNLALRFVPVNVVAYLVAPPHVDPQFPFVHLVPIGLPARPPGYMTVEAVAGILCCVPALVLLPGAALLARRGCPAARAMTAALVAQAAAMLALLACFRWAAARYLVDVLPFLAVATAIGWCALGERRSARILRVAAGALLAQAIVFNLCVGLTGKFQEVAGDFARRLEAAAAPLQRFWLRHAADRYGDITMTLVLPAGRPGTRETLLAAGTIYRREVICIEAVGRRQVAFVLMSRGGEQLRTPPLRLARDAPHTVEIDMGALLPLDTEAMARIWPAESVEEWRRRFRIRVDGEEVLAASYDFRPPSPYIGVGANWFGPDYCSTPFSGRISGVRRRLPAPVP